MKNVLSSFARVKVLALVLGALATLPALAHGQTYKGKFSLANETHWGSAVLAPGDYDFSLEPSVTPSRVVVRGTNGNVVAILISMWSSDMGPAKINRLQLETHEGGVYISALYLSDLDTQLHFNIPKTKESVIAREAVKLKSSALTASAQ